jgi:transcriptional regulator with XRE-family HTH domain
MSDRRRSQRLFSEEVPRLLAERGMSQQALADLVGVSQSHLSRVLRQVDYKTPSRELLRKVALAFELPEDYFPEYREMVVLEAIRADPELRDRLYRRVRASAPA